MNLKLNIPLTKPINKPSINTAKQANQGGTPLDIKDIKATFDDPITKGIDKSKPPNKATNVCPTVAKPKKAAKTNIDFIFNNVKKPGIVNEPMMNKPIRTDIPVNTLFVPFIYLLITPMNIIKAKKIKNETNVLPEKKPSAINDTNIKIRIIPRKAIVFHLCSLIFLKKEIFFVFFFYLFFFFRKFSKNILL